MKFNDEKKNNKREKVKMKTKLKKKKLIKYTVRERDFRCQFCKIL